MANACCINAYDVNGNFLCTLKTIQSEEIGQDVCFYAGDINDTEVQYVCYTDKCGCCCRLDNENELKIHYTNGELKNVNVSAKVFGLGVKWCEIYGGNWAKTMVRYKTGGYPTSISDGTLAVTETTKNQYSVNGYCFFGLTAGTVYYVKIFALDSSNNVLGEAMGSGTPSNFQDTFFSYTGAEQSLTLSPGTYKLQVWGAQGGVGYQNCPGGKGGYSEGCLTLTTITNVYVYVGEMPSTCAGGRNGGGRGNNGRADNHGGGGGTDIRVGGNTLYYRRIVAGGGGGGNHAGTTGIGGGCCGVGNTQYPGTQTSAGNGGSFGQGANICGNTSYPTGGAGGGWYGGGGLVNGSNGYCGSGGGSGYVYTSSTCGNAPSGYSHCTQHFLSGAYSCAGNVSFPAPNGSTETGHSGCGCAKISLV